MSLEQGVGGAEFGQDLVVAHHRQRRLGRAREPLQHLARKTRLRLRKAAPIEAANSRGAVLAFRSQRMSNRGEDETDWMGDRLGRGRAYTGSGADAQLRPPRLHRAAATTPPPSGRHRPELPASPTLRASRQPSSPAGRPRFADARHRPARRPQGHPGPGHADRPGGARLPQRLAAAAVRDHQRLRPRPAGHRARPLPPRRQSRRRRAIRTTR